MIKKSLFVFILIFAIACTYRQYPTVEKIVTIHDTVIVKIPASPIVPPSTTNPIDSLLYQVHIAGTPNFNLRKPNYVIIHHTAQDSCGQTFYTFSLQRTNVSAHYVICKDGSVHQLLNDYLRAWHAGISKWGNNTDVNSCSIGIELDNNGKEPFADSQINSLLILLDTLKNKYNIPASNFIGHAYVAPRRKDDPSVFFPWKLLSTKGFGLWYDSLPLPPNAQAALNPMEALRIIGYDTKDSVKAVIAFKRHFLQNDTSKVLNQWDRQILFNLYKKYL